MSPALESSLPPGPRLPRVIQTLGFMLLGPRYLEACRRRYGEAVTMSTLFDGPFVMVFDPTLVKQVFQGSNEQLHAGEANAILGPILGQRSILLLDGGEHLRHRRLLLPPFHGQRMQRYAQAMIAATDREIDAWPVGDPFAVLPSMQALTLQVVMRAVFGFDPGPAEDELRARLRAMIEPITRRRRGMILFALSQGRLGGSSSAEGFLARRRAVDEILFAEIARRRGDPDLAAREDVFSALLLAEDEDGGRLSDQEVRDELVTLLVAGHETTATALAWTLDLLLHSPPALARARQATAAGDDDAYLDAVVKESLRMRPIIPAVGRVVRGEPFALGAHAIPPGVEINPAIRIIHRRADLYPRPLEFGPERFLGPDAPDTYTWLPFGGGTRRCLGASFALMEMRVVLGRILQRAELRPAAKDPDKVEFRAITLAPRDGVRVLMPRRPAGEPAAVAVGLRPMASSPGRELADAHETPV